MNPLVTIIIPVYNRADVIAETLESVQAQTYQNWECIVVDDRSTDGTKTITEEICKADQRFSYCNNQRTKGAPGARNTGLDLAKGELISFFDSDDQLLPNYIQNKLKYFLENNRLDIVISLSKRIENGKKECFTNVPTIQHPLIRFYSLYPNADIPWFTPSLIKRSFILENNIKWDESVLVYQDIQFNVSMLSKSPFFVWCTDRFDWCWVFRDNVNNTANNKHDELLITKKLIEVYWSNLENGIIAKRLKGKVSKQYHYQLISFCDKLSHNVKEEHEFFQFIKSKSNFNGVDIWLLKNRIRFVKKMPVNLKERIFWKFIRLYFKLSHPPLVKEGNYLKRNEL